MEDIECCRHSKVALRCIVPPRRCAGLACRVNFKVAMLGRAVDLPAPPGSRRPATVRMSDHPPYDLGPAESVSLDLDAATRRLMAAPDAWVPPPPPPGALPSPFPSISTRRRDA